MSKKSFDDKVKKNVEWAERQEAPAEVKPETVEPEVVPMTQTFLDNPMLNPPEIFTNHVGAPTKYNKMFPNQAKVLASKGFTEMDLAQAFMVCKATITNWKKEHPEFLASINEGREMMDANVEKALIHRAMGYSHKEDKVFCSEGQIITKEVVKHYPPDPTSIIFWLKNRKPNEWRDKRDIDLNTPFTIVMGEADQGTL